MERLHPPVIARICHEANRVLQTHIGEAAALVWPLMDSDHRASVIDGVHKALDNPDLTPEQSHENWLAFKRAAGWEYGPTKNDELRVHPCLVPWSALPAEQRAKDTLFLGIVIAMGAIGG